MSQFRLLAVFPAIAYWIFLLSPTNLVSFTSFLIFFRAVIIIYGLAYIPFTLHRFGNEFIKNSVRNMKWAYLTHSYIAILIGLAMIFGLLLDLTVGINYISALIMWPSCLLLSYLVIKFSMNPSLGKIMLDRNG